MGALDQEDEDINNFTEVSSEKEDEDINDFTEVSSEKEDIYYGKDGKIHVSRSNPTAKYYDAGFGDYRVVTLHRPMWWGLYKKQNGLAFTEVSSDKDPNFTEVSSEAEGRPVIGRPSYYSDAIGGGGVVFTVWGQEMKNKAEAQWRRKHPDLWKKIQKRL